MEEVLGTDSEYLLEVPSEVIRELEQVKKPHLRSDLIEGTDLDYVDVSLSHYHSMKRFLDICLSLIGILVLLIPMLIIAMIVYIDAPGKIIFSQYRIGYFGRLFKLYKFRTMKLDTPEYLSTAEIVNPDKYITRVGGFLRKFSLDELLQLFNVLKGDMSLVGPRPLIHNEYEIHEMRKAFGVYNVRPGITGLAQINGRDLVTQTEKVCWDVEYLKHFGFRQDVKIIFVTLPKILMAKNVVEGHQETEEEKPAWL